MSNTAREIMYIGRKERRTDNVTGNPGRIWNGLGDIQRVTELEAQRLVRHADVWADVTEWPEGKRIETVEKIRDKVRAEKRAFQPKVTLDVASEEELENELFRRRHPGGKAPAKNASAPNVPIIKPGDHTDPNTGDAATRPATPAEVVHAIIGAVMLMDLGKPELFDEKQNPKLEAVVAALGYQVSKSELNAALKEFNKPT